MGQDDGKQKQGNSRIGNWEREMKPIVCYNKIPVELISIHPCGSSAAQLLSVHLSG